MVECITTSAPSASGFCSAGVAKVLSQASSAPCACASCASAAMSATCSCGLEGVSAHSSRVAGVQRRAQRVEVAEFGHAHGDAARRQEFLAEHAHAGVAVARDQHLAARRQRFQQRDHRRHAGSEGQRRRAALHRRQRRFQAILGRVALALCIRSRRRRSPAGPCAKVVARCSGGASAPVCASGAPPACTARVSGRIVVSVEVEAARAQVRRATRRGRCSSSASRPARARALDVVGIVVDEQRLRRRDVAEPRQAGVEGFRLRLPLPQLAGAHDRRRRTAPAVPGRSSRMCSPTQSPLLVNTAMRACVDSARHSASIVGPRPRGQRGARRGSSASSSFQPWRSRRPCSDSRRPISPRSLAMLEALVAEHRLEHRFRRRRRRRAPAPRSAPAGRSPRARRRGRTAPAAGAAASAGRRLAEGRARRFQRQRESRRRRARTTGSRPRRPTAPGTRRARSMPWKKRRNAATSQAVACAKVSTFWSVKNRPNIAQLRFVVSGTPASRAAASKPSHSWCVRASQRLVEARRLDQLQRRQARRHRHRIAAQRAGLVDRAARRDLPHQVARGRRRRRPACRRR